MMQITTFGRYRPVYSCTVHKHKRNRPLWLNQGQRLDTFTLSFMFS